MRATRVAVLLAAAFLSPAVWADKYPTNGECDGFPKIDVATPKGFCVGLIADDFKFPRGLLPLPGGDLLVVDMRSWDPNKGSLWRMQRNGKQWSKSQLFSKLDRPNGLALGPDGMVYLGVVGGVMRFDPKAAQPALQAVIGGDSGIEPLQGTGRHPLVSLLFDAEGQLLVNVGSASDNCDKANGPSCAEAEGEQARGVVRRYRFDKPGGKVTGWSIYARGLRNSMALALHSSGSIWQGENSRDAINKKINLPDNNDNDLPHDEINRLTAGSSHGWPYCYDMNVNAPEFPKYDCRKQQAPVVLLPGHAAPLGMTFYTAKQFPAPWQGRLLVGFHGYRDNGHRVVAYDVAADGTPQGKPIPLIEGWGPKDTQPMGAPVDVRVGADGAVYISEDRNGTVLRLVYRGG
ncbi:sorbosone dehydrogenase family protein [Leeia sp.]|uniref:PQQ-dependent sugar dehydrogenase n=1 Tax=Leeia sp. TaxID=2884678 RepID=UPI0035AD81E9